MRDRRRDYELMFIISPLQSSEEEITGTIERVHQAAITAGGEILSTNQSSPWGRRKLAYPIRKYMEGESSRRVFTEGYYVLTYLRLSTLQVSEFERLLKLNQSLLRYLLTLVEQKGHMWLTDDADSTGTINSNDSVADDADGDTMSDSAIQEDDDTDDADIIDPVDPDDDTEEAINSEEEPVEEPKISS